MRKYVQFECPKCKGALEATIFGNSAVKWIEGRCQSCGYIFKIKDYEWDLIQPSNPLWPLVYEGDPIAEERKRNESLEVSRKEEKEKSRFLRRKQGRLKKWDLDFVNKYERDRGLDD